MYWESLKSTLYNKILFVVTFNSFYFRYSILPPAERIILINYSNRSNLLTFLILLMLSVYLILRTASTFVPLNMSILKFFQHLSLISAKDSLQYLSLYFVPCYYKRILHYTIHSKYFIYLPFLYTYYNIKHKKVTKTIN